MSVANPAARSLLCRSLAANSARPTYSSPATTGACRLFHNSSPLAARRKPRFKSIKAVEMGLIDPKGNVEDQKMEQYVNKRFPKPVKADWAAFRQQYTPEQLTALEAGEKAIDPRDLAIQGRLRSDPYKPEYLEDFATIRPVVDKRVKTHTPIDPHARFMTPDEFGDDFAEWATEMHKRGGPQVSDREEAYKMWQALRAKMLNKPLGKELTAEEINEVTEAGWRRMNNEKPGKPEKTSEELDAEGENGEDAKPLLEEKDQISDLEAYKYLMDRHSMTGYDGGDTVLAQGLPDKVPGVAGLAKDVRDQEDVDEDPEGLYDDLKHYTGLDMTAIKDLEKTSKILVTRWVSNQTRLGKIRSSYCLAITGNRDGRLGLGEAKSTDFAEARRKALQLSIRNMKPIRRYENRTIYGRVEVKVGATIVQLASRPPGFGLRVSHRIFEMARAAGIKDLAARMPRARNPMNSVKATYMALLNQPDPEKIAIGRGKKLVDARKVYYGGAVY